ncbi:unnamed protein product [Prunus brigantina]
MASCFQPLDEGTWVESAGGIRVRGLFGRNKRHRLDRVVDLVNTWMAHMDSDADIHIKPKRSEIMDHED